MTQFFFTVLGGFISGFVSFWLFCHQRHRKAKDQFLVFISLISMQIDTNDVLGVFKTTLPQIRDAVAKVSPFLKNSELRSLNEAWKAYAGTEHNLLVQNHEDYWQHSFRKEMNTPGPEMPIEILKSRLNKMSEAAK